MSGVMETYYGHVRTPVDAIKLFEACRLGLLPRVQRRLSEKERQAIRSGSVFVWDEREAGMRRWTDGKSWSASRVSGSFLTYREMEGKRGNAFGGHRRGAGKTPDSGRGSDEDHDDGEPDGYRYKPDGLMKQSFSITTSSGQHLHLIAYYARGMNDLPQPSTDPALRHIVPAKGMYPESSLNETPVPALTRTPMHPAYPPHHHPHHQPGPYPGYPLQFPHMGYWPPSPVGTPPYSHGQHPYSQAPPHAYPSHPHPHYPPAAPSHPYDRAPLPLPPPQPHPHSQHHPHPTPQLPAPLPSKPGMPLPQICPPSQHNPTQGPPHRSPHPHSPRPQHLQAQTREAVQVDPRLGLSPARNHPPGPLPAPIPPSSRHPQQNGAALPPPPIVTTSPISHHLHPSQRSLSASPPRSAGPTLLTPSEGSNQLPPLTPIATTNHTSNSNNNNSSSSSNGNVVKTPVSSLPVSALLHPTPPPVGGGGGGERGSEPSSANSARSASSSPRTTADATATAAAAVAVATAAAAAATVNGSAAAPEGGGGGAGAVGGAGSNGSGGAGSQSGPAGEDARAIGVLNKNFCG
ncbi:hypothetical protein VTK26DRAFT_9264 [Humicola hyalothermophila]